MHLALESTTIKFVTFCSSAYHIRLRTLDNRAGGEAGRDGKPSSALLFFDARKEQFKMDNLPEDRKKSFQAMIFPSTFYLTNNCRR